MTWNKVRRQICIIQRNRSKLRRIYTLNKNISTCKRYIRKRQRICQQKRLGCARISQNPNRVRISQIAWNRHKTIMNKWFNTLHYRVRWGHFLQNCATHIINITGQITWLRNKTSRIRIILTLTPLFQFKTIWHNMPLFPTKPTDWGIRISLVLCWMIPRTRRLYFLTCSSIWPICLTRVTFVYIRILGRSNISTVRLRRSTNETRLMDQSMIIDKAWCIL